jgi:hypothetical protein
MDNGIICIMVEFVSTLGNCVKRLSNLLALMIKDFVYTRRIDTNCEFIQSQYLYKLRGELIEYKNFDVQGRNSSTTQ